MSLNHDTRPLLTPRLVVGLSAIVLGIMLTFDRLGLINAGNFFRLWPLVPILIGGQIFFDARRQAGRTNGAIWMIVGGLLLLNTMGIARIRVWEMLWPTVLILIGSHLVLHATRRTSIEPAKDDSDQVSVIAILSGVKQTASAGRFRGGEISAFMGLGQVDLRQATIPPGEEATIELFALMAACEIYVPPGWTVSTPLAAVMAGVEDQRLPPWSGPETIVQSAPAPRLVLRGFVMMGSIEIKS